MAPPPRIFGICATDAPVAALIVRTSGWQLAARWDVDSGKVTAGQWLRGKIYARRSDVSPDGALLYTFAMKGGKPYHAISRLPWLTALAFWQDDSTWTNGAHFAPLGRGVATTFGAPDKGDIAPLARKHRLALVSNPRPQAYGVELRRGWGEHEQCPPRAPRDTWDERREQLLYRAQPNGRMRLVLVDHGTDNAIGAVDYRRPSYYLEHLESKVQTPLAGVTWADWSPRGRLLVATAAGAVELRDAKTGAVLASHSFAGALPDPRVAPASAQRW